MDRELSLHSKGWQQHESVWMPRYLAIALPAIFVAASVLLLRIPTRPLQCLAILVFVAVNLSVHGSRVLAGSEPPMPLIIRDLIDSQPASNQRPDDVLTRTYFDSGIAKRRRGEPRRCLTAFNERTLLRGHSQRPGKRLLGASWHGRAICAFVSGRRGITI